MSKNEINVLRANLVCGMDTYVREVIGDDDVTEYWLALGMPDGSDEESIMEDVADEETFNDWCMTFATCIKIASREE